MIPVIPTHAFRLILSLTITSCENHQVETTDGFSFRRMQAQESKRFEKALQAKAQMAREHSSFPFLCCSSFIVATYHLSYHLKLYYCCLHFPHAFTCALLPLLTTSCFNSCSLVVACTLASTCTFLMLFTLFLLWFMISFSYLYYLDLPDKVLTLLLGALSLYCTQCSLALLLNALLLISSPFMFC